MTGFYAYTRVSTQKQGVKGVSLEEQRGAIERYAVRHNLRVTQWFEERLTAAKRGRPLFNTMLKGLKRGEAKGIIIHKIDRGARNLRDWADLGELIDSGVSVHFANESLDLQSRGGRLSADIQAVVAADFIRNLRDETLKGIRGRLKQGLYPFGAPLGYLNTGVGRAKEIDPASGPLMRDAFHLFASGRYTLKALAEELYRRGLRNRAGQIVDPENLSGLLRKPFYAGFLVLRSTGETFLGKHRALVSVDVFKTVVARLDGNVRLRPTVHDYLYRGLFQCAMCQRFLIGERQKGRVYYRCHERCCPTKTFREDILDAAVLRSLGSMAPSPEWRALLRAQLEYVLFEDRENGQQQVSNLLARLAASKARESTLLDAFLDGALDRETYESRRRLMLEEQRALQESIDGRPLDVQAARQFVQATLELAATAQQSYELADHAAKREMLRELSSNRFVFGKNVSIEPSERIALIGGRAHSDAGSPHCNSSRTVETAARELWEWAKNEVRNLGSNDSETP